MPKITKRDFAKAVGLKLNKLKHLRIAKTILKCAHCLCKIEKTSFYFVELANKPLPEPIVTAQFIMKTYPVVIATYCIECSQKRFTSIYRKRRDK